MTTNPFAVICHHSATIHSSQSTAADGFCSGGSSPPNQSCPWVHFIDPDPIQPNPLPGEFMDPRLNSTHTQANHIQRRCNDAPNCKFSQSRIIASQRKVAYIICRPSYVHDIILFFANLPFQTHDPTQPTKNKNSRPTNNPTQPMGQPMGWVDPSVGLGC